MRDNYNNNILYPSIGGIGGGGSSSLDGYNQENIHEIYEIDTYNTSHRVIGNDDKFYNFRDDKKKTYKELFNNQDGVPNTGGGGSGEAGNVNPGPSIGGLGGGGTAFPGFEYPLVGLSPLTPHSPSNNQYGGGGTGWGYSPGASQRGGYGGGGRGQTYPGTAPKDATPGVNNLGGGGGGAYPERGKSGGSGIVIVRYSV